MGSPHDLILDCMASTHLDKEKILYNIMHREPVNTLSVEIKQS